MKFKGAGHAVMLAMNKNMLSKPTTSIPKTAEVSQPTLIEDPCTSVPETTDLSQPKLTEDEAADICQPTLIKNASIGHTKHE